MKKLLILFILFLCSRSVNAQTINVTQVLAEKKTNAWFKGVLTVDSAIRLPSHDTTYTPSRIFTLTVRAQDNTPYLWIGTRWVAFALTGGTYVNSFNNRIGVVVPVDGDYDASMVTNAVDETQLYFNPVWIASLDYGKLTGAPALFNPVQGYGIIVGSVYPNNTFSFDSATVHPVVDVNKVSDSVFSVQINNRPLKFITLPGRGGGTGGVGTVTLFSFNPANGIIGSVSTATSTPSLTLGTTLNGIVYANGTSFLSANIGAGLSFLSGTLANTITNNNQLANGSNFISNISGLVVPGNNATVTGAGTSFNPYVIGFSGAVLGGTNGSTDSIKHLPVDTSAAPRNGDVLAFDSVNHKWYLTPNGTGGVGGSVTLFSFTPANGFTGVVTNATTTPNLTLTMQNAVDNGLTKGISAYTAADFNLTSGVVAIDYTNGQKATASVPGFLTAADWTTFNNKISGSLASGNIYVGNVSNVATAVAMSGDVFISNSGVTTIQSSVVTYAKIQNVLSQRLLGRYAGTTGVTQEISLNYTLALNSGTGVLSADTTKIATRRYVDSLVNLTDSILLRTPGVGTGAIPLAFASGGNLVIPKIAPGGGIVFTVAGDSLITISSTGTGIVPTLQQVFTAGSTFTGNNTITAAGFTLSVSGGVLAMTSSRFEEAQGASVAAANNLTLGSDGTLFPITGNTQINAITTTNFQAGSRIAFIFTGTPTIKNNTAGGGGTAPMLLAGRVDYNATAGDYIAFQYNGTNWYETNRKVSASVGSYVFSNGITESPVGTVKLGGTFASTTLDGLTTGQLLIQGSTSTANGLFYVNNTLASGNNVAIKGQSIDGGGVVGISSTNSAVSGTSTSGSGGAFQSTSGPGVTATSTSGLGGSFTIAPSSTSTVVTIANFVRSSTGTAANGIGGSLDFYIKSTTGTSLVNTIQSKLTDATGATATSQLTFRGITGGGTMTDLLIIDGNGSLTTTGGRLDNIVTTAAGTYTILATDFTVIATGTTSTWTFPAAVTKRRLNLVNHGSGAVTLGTAVTTANATTTTNLAAGASYDIQYDGTVWRKIN